MIRFGKKPNDKAIEDYIRHCQTLDFNYPYVGKTRDLIDTGEAPQGFRLDRSAHHPHAQEQNEKEEGAFPAVLVEAASVVLDQQRHRHRVHHLQDYLDLRRP